VRTLGGRSASAFGAGAIAICNFALSALGLWQSITLQQFIETAEPARQGIVTFFTIFLLPVYYPVNPLSTALFHFTRHSPALNSATPGRCGKDQNYFQTAFPRWTYARVANGSTERPTIDDHAQRAETGTIRAPY
jgi:hypothetical protein